MPDLPIAFMLDLLVVLIGKIVKTIDERVFHGNKTQLPGTW
jgi:hypothetical protein